MTPDQLGPLAQSLKDNEVLQLAFDKTRNGALEALARVPATDIEAIHEYQATIRVVDSIRTDLEQFIRSGKPKPKPGIA